MENKRKSMEKTVSLFFISTVVFVALLTANHMANPTWDLIIWGLLILFAFITVVCNQILRHERHQYQSMYYDGRKMLSDMIKIIDWTTFRKRQLYRTNDMSAIKDINMFLRESQETMSPVKDGYQYNQLTTLCLNIILWCGMITLLFLHKQYLKDLIHYTLDLVSKI